MRALVLLALAAPAAALTDAQLANQVKAERRQYDNAMNAFESKKQSWNDAGNKMQDLKDKQQDGVKRASVGGESCKIMNCINRQQKIVEKREKAAEAALAKAREQAQQYLDKEEQYRLQTGHNFDPSSIAGANEFLAESSKVGGGPTPVTDGGIEPPSEACGQYKTCIPDVGQGTDNPEVADDTPDYQHPGMTPDQLAAAAGGHVPGTGLGELGTGHEAQDLAQYARGGAQEFGAASHAGGGGGPGRFLADRAPALGGEPPLMSARAELQRGDLAAAAAAVQRALRENPRSFEANLLDAQARNAQGDWAGAETAARRAIALDPSNPEAYKALAVALLHQGKDEEALAAADKAAALDPDDAESQMLRAFAFEGLGRKDEMMKAVEKAASLDARFLPYLDLARKGKVLFDRRRTARGWRGFPIPDLAAPTTGKAPDAAPAAPKATVVLLGGVLLAAAAALLGLAAWKKRRDAGRIVVRST